MMVHLAERADQRVVTKTISAIHAADARSDLDEFTCGDSETDAPESIFSEHRPSIDWRR